MPRGCHSASFFLLTNLYFCAKINALKTLMRRVHSGIGLRELRLVKRSTKDIMEDGLGVVWLTTVV